MSVPPRLQPLPSSGYPQEGEWGQQSPSFPRDCPPAPAPIRLLALCLVISCTPHHIHQDTSFPPPFLLRSLIPAPVPTASCITHPLVTAWCPDPGPKRRGSDKGWETRRGRGKRRCHEDSYCPFPPPI